MSNRQAGTQEKIGSKRALRRSPSLSWAVGAPASVFVETLVVALALWATWYMCVNVWHLLSQDVVEYRRYAEQFWYTHPRFRALPTEYPPLAIGPFSLTLISPGWDPWGAFAVWMGAAALTLYFVLKRFASRAHAVVCVVYLLLGASAVFLERYDVIPALVSVVALWAASRQRYAWAYTLLAVGILLKLYPAFLVPVVAIEQWRHLGSGDGGIASGSLSRTDGGRGAIRAVRESALRFVRLPATRRVLRDAALAVGLTLAGFAIAFALSPSGALSEFRYAKDRPIQIESLPATLLWFGTFLRFPAHAVFSFKSFNYVGPLDRVLMDLSAVGLVAGCLWVYLRQAQGRLSLSRAMLATVCVVVVSNKVFSAQYLIWVAPLVAAVEGFSFLWVAICLLTTIEYPIIYNQHHVDWAIAYNSSYLVVVALRNTLLVLALLRIILKNQTRRGVLSFAGNARAALPTRLLSARAAHTYPVGPDSAYQRGTDWTPSIEDASATSMGISSQRMGGTDES